MQSRSLFLAAALAALAGNAARAQSHTGDEAPPVRAQTAALELHAPSARLKVTPAAKAHKAVKPARHARPERHQDDEIQQLG